MTRTYNLTGVTCNNCKASVEKALNTIDAIEVVSIDLENSEATLKMSHLISNEELQSVLPSKYVISEASSYSDSISESKESVSDLKQLFPLFLIFGYIIGASVLLNKNEWNTNNFMLDFMGLFYIVFSFFKLLDLKGFPESFRMYDPLAKVIPAYGWLYPFIELTLGLLFLMRFQISLALISTLIILGITTIGVTRALLSKNTIQCACLGTALKLPMTKATFIENTIMIVMAIVMLLKTYN
ncbi:heavy-metal-associated domain-containing protein [Psychroserpens sp.]|uniref:heavy-metal-associated domain-containing protein n=1 Tax=Psychroserpens sp. TaxID=2020870 RepID=UPI00385D7511